MSLLDTTSSQDHLRGVPGAFNFEAQPASRRAFSSFDSKAQSPLRGIARTAFDYPLGIWMALDLAIGVASLAIAHTLSPAYQLEQSHSYNISIAAAAFSLLLFIFNYALGLYDRHNFASVGRIVRLGILANLLALALMTLVYSWIPFVQLGRIVLVVTFAHSTFALIACRLAARALARRAKIRVLFVGRPAHFLSLARKIQEQFGDFYDQPSYVDFAEIPHHKRADALAAALAWNKPDDIVIEDEEAILAELFKRSAVILCAGISLRSYRTYFEQLLGCLPVEVLDNRNVLGNDFVLGNCRGGAFKRLLDIVLVCFGFSVGLPLFILAAIVVRLTSPGPVIYSQVRVGLYGRPFRIYKFRTMRIDAEKNGAVWATVGDKRVTPVGNLLRKTRLDELPQLWNILRGDMSFVGPRPERPEFVDDLKDKIRHYDLRHLVLPGLTGWAQIRYRYGASSDDAKKKLAYDLYYVQHRGPAFDLAICARTVVAMAKGAR